MQIPSRKVTLDRSIKLVSRVGEKKKKNNRDKCRDWNSQTKFSFLRLTMKNRAMVSSSTVSSIYDVRYREREGTLRSALTIRGTPLSRIFLGNERITRHPVLDD